MEVRIVAAFGCEWVMWVFFVGLGSREKVVRATYGFNNTGSEF